MYTPSKVELDNYGAHTEAQGTGSLRQGGIIGTQCIGTLYVATQGTRGGGTPTRGGGG
jgi:hypothetical protein